ncbi:extracellular OTU-like cysteine protease [Talaromyces pinophilus]|uniref:Extracellular OTU-like cysteine protease n=1 Tax=Talaromyces pinophilus TaxID=128442 RepID=A0A6V8H386_TALPI|nr:Ovarian tumor, otubain [Penicillium occitanis (nom. inval.)]PCH04106.1 hypothetical protein PENOC_035450 [Penicillium occitanis (nom. inval.)]GAM34485.1 extracellular OTU-like cysteine protease [Talaromyces pinophilus]
MADSPANRSRIVPIMADQKEAFSTTAPAPAPAATAKSAPKPKSTTRKSTAIPKSTVSSNRTTRSQTRALGLDDVNVNLKTLEARGLYVFDTKGDGNCLYYALSDQMYGDWDHATEIRDNLSAHMEANREYFAGFAVAKGGERRSKRTAAAPRRIRTPLASPSPTSSEIEDAFQDMVSRTATNYIWGGAEEIQACCQFYKRDIRVYSEDHVQDFRAWNAPDGELRDFLHLAYINNVHYSSVRNVDGPHEGMPNVKAKEPANPVVLDLETAQPWKISCIQEGLGGQYDHDAIVEMLRRCRGNIDRAFANLLDEESSSASSFVSSANSAASSQTSATTSATIPKQHISQPNTGALMANFKPRLMSSRSSSRHSTASKRSADDSDNEGPIPAVRQRGREQKRRILPKVTVGINFGDQEKPDLVSLRLRVNSDADAERISPIPSPLEQPEQPKPNPKPTEGRKLRPRKPRTSVASEADSTSTISSESPLIKAEE